MGAYSRVGTFSRVTLIRSITVFHSRLQETIKSKRIAPYIVQKVDNFVKEIRALDADEVDGEIEDIDEDAESGDSEGGGTKT